jgi:hypothetical protein
VLQLFRREMKKMAVSMEKWWVMWLIRCGGFAWAWSLQPALVRRWCHYKIRSAHKRRRNLGFIKFETVV